MWLCLIRQVDAWLMTKNLDLSFSEKTLWNKHRCPSKCQVVIPLHLLTWPLWFRLVFLVALPPFKDSMGFRLSGLRSLWGPPDFRCRMEVKRIRWWWTAAKWIRRRVQGFETKTVFSAPVAVLCSALYISSRACWKIAKHRFMNRNHSFLNSNHKLFFLPNCSFAHS